MDVNRQIPQPEIGSIGSQTGAVAQKQGKPSVGYITTAVVLSLGASQVVGGLSIIAKTIDSIYRGIKIGISSLAAKKVVDESRAKILKVLGEQEIGKSLEVEKQEDVGLESLQADHEKDEKILEQNTQDIVGAAIGMIPLAGLFLEGLFRKAVVGGDKAGVGGDVSLTTAEKAMHKLLGGIVGSPRERMYPGNTHKKLSVEDRAKLATKDVGKREEWNRDLGSEYIGIPVDRGDGKEGHKIHCQYIGGDNSKNKTMILCHGNAMVAEDMKDHAAFYKERGWNVLAVTMGGYRGSDEKIETTEATNIQDAKAVVDFLNGKGVNDIGVHGFSIGGTLAMHVTQLSDKVKFAYFDKTLTSIPDVGANSVFNEIRSKVPFFPSSLVPSYLVKSFMKSGFPAGEKVLKSDGDPIRDKHGNPYTTSGGNILEKMKNDKNPPFVVVFHAAKRDDLMGHGTLTSQKYSGNFGEDLYHIYSDSHPGKTAHLITSNETHVKDNFKEYNSLVKSLEKSLEDNGLKGKFEKMTPENKTKLVGLMVKFYDYQSESLDKATVLTLLNKQMEGVKDVESLMNNLQTFLELEVVIKKGNGNQKPDPHIVQSGIITALNQVEKKMGKISQANI